MNRRAAVSDPMPDPSMYRSEDDLSLGTHLLEWMDRQVDRETFGGRRPRNELLRVEPRWRFAESLASNSDASCAALGQALLIGLDGDWAGAGREYRKACRTRKAALRAAKARYANAVKTCRVLNSKSAVLQDAIKILSEQQQRYPQRPVPSDAELARRAKRRLNLKLSERTVRSYLSSPKSIRKG